LSSLKKDFLHSHGTPSELAAALLSSSLREHLERLFLLLQAKSKAESRRARRTITWSNFKLADPKEKFDVSFRGE
jgi:hypothetical protein